MNPYDLSKAIAASSDVMNLLSEDARYFFKFSLHGPRPVMFYQYKYPLRQNSAVSLDSMRSSLNGFIMRKSMEEARITFYNGEARRQVQQAATNMDVETNYRLTLRTHVDLYGMESAAAELCNFMNTTAQRVKREVDMYSHILTSASKQETLLTLRSVERSVLELSYAALLRTNISSDYETILLDRLLASIALEAAGTGNSGVTGFFSLETASKASFSRPQLIDSEASRSSTNNPTVPAVEAVTTEESGPAKPTEQDESPNENDGIERQQTDDLMQECAPLEAASIQILMDSHHTPFQLFTEYIEKLLDSISSESIISDLSSYYDILSMYSDLPEVSTDPNKQQAVKESKPSITSSQKDSIGTKSKSVKPVVSKEDDLSFGHSAPSVSSSSAQPSPLPDFLARYEKCRTCPNLYNPGLSVLFQSPLYQKTSAAPLTDFADITRKIIMRSAAVTRRPSVTIASKVVTRGNSPSGAKRSPSSTASSKKASQTPATQTPITVSKELCLDTAAVLDDGYLDYNQLLDVFKHIYHFYQHCVDPSRDVKLLRCNTTDPSFSLSDYVRALASNGQNNLSQASIADAAFFVEFSALLSKGSLDDVDLFTDLLHHGQADLASPSPSLPKQKGSAERPRSKTVATPGSRIELDGPSSSTSPLLDSLDIELISVGDLVNYLRFLNTFIDDSYETRARQSLLREIQDLVCLELWKSDNDIVSIRNYLINKGSVQYASLANHSLDCQARMPTAFRDDNYFTLLLANLNNDPYIKMLIDRVDLIFVTGDPVSGKTLVTTELSRRLSSEQKISTGIVDAYSVYRSLYEELMRILDDRGTKQESHDGGPSPTIYLEDELMSDLLTLHNNLLYVQLTNAQPGARFYPHPLHNPKSLSDGLILNSNSIANCPSATDLNEHSADSPIQSLHQRAPGRSTLRDELPIDTETLSSQTASCVTTRDSMAQGVRTGDPAHITIQNNASSGDNFLSPNEAYRDGSLFSQHEGEITDDQSDTSHHQNVRFSIPPDVQAILRTPEQYMLFYRAIQRRVRKSLLSKTGPSELSANKTSPIGPDDQSSELQEIERVCNGPDDLAGTIEVILSGKDCYTPDRITIDVTDVHQINRFVARSMLVQAITQGLLSNYTCLIFDGFPNAVSDIHTIEDLLNGCLTEDSLQRLLDGYFSYTVSNSDQPANSTTTSCVAPSLDDPLLPVFIKRSGITSLIYLHDSNFESLCRRLYGRLFISSHPVESDDLFDMYLTNYQMSRRDPYSTEFSTNDAQWLVVDPDPCKASACVTEQEESMTDDADNPKKQYFPTSAKTANRTHKRGDHSMSSDSDFSPSTSMDYSSNEDESTDPDCERIRKKFPIGSDSPSPRHPNMHTHTSPDSVATIDAPNARASKGVLYNSRRLNLSADTFAAYGTGLKIPAHEIRDVGFMNSATLDVLNTNPVKDSVLFGEDYTRPPVEIPLKPVAQWTDLPTRNASKANLSLLSIYTTTSLGFAPWADEKGDDHLTADDTFIKSYPIVDPQAYDAFCKAVAQNAVRLSTGCQNKAGHADSPLHEEQKSKPSVAEVFFSYLFFGIYRDSFADFPQHVIPHKHEVIQNLIQLNYENRLLINRVDVELASYKQKRDVLLIWMQRTYGKLQPRVFLPPCIQADSLFRRLQHESDEFEAYLVETVDQEEALAPSILCVCDVDSLFSKSLAAFSDGQSGSVFAEELGEVGNRVYHHVLRAIEHRKRSVSSTSYELQAMLSHKLRSKDPNTQQHGEKASFATEFLELYQRELGLQTPSTEYLDYPIPEPPLDGADLKKSKPAPAKAQGSKAKGATPSDVAYVAPNPLTTFNLPQKFFSETVSSTLQDITKGYKQRQAFMKNAIRNITILQSAVTDILTHESVGQTDLLTGFYDLSLEHTQATFVEFLNFYKSIDQDARSQPNIKADALLLIDKCLAQCNDDIFKTKVRSDALINGLTTRYLRISAKMSLDILSISDYKEVVSKYLSLITKDREPGITLGVLLFQYVSFLYDIMWEDVAYVSLILFTLHELSLRAYDASNNVLHDILAEFSVDSEQEALAEAYNTQLESLLKGRQVTPAMIGQQVAQLRSQGRVSSPVLIVGTSCLQEHVQQKNQKPYEGYAVALDPLYSLAKSLAGSSDEHQGLLLKMKERAVVGQGQDSALTVEEYAHYNYQSVKDSVDQLNDLIRNGMLISQGAGATVTRVHLHSVYNGLIMRIFEKLENKLSFTKQQVQTYISICTDGLSNTLLKIGDMIDNLYASTLSVAASAARAMQTVVDEEVDILGFHIDMEAKRISIETIE